MWILMCLIFLFFVWIVDVRLMQSVLIEINSFDFFVKLLLPVVFHKKNYYISLYWSLFMFRNKTEKYVQFNFEIKNNFKFLQYNNKKRNCVFHFPENLVKDHLIFWRSKREFFSSDFRSSLGRFSFFSKNNEKWCGKWKDENAENLKKTLILVEINYRMLQRRLLHWFKWNIGHLWKWNNERFLRRR